MKVLLVSNMYAYPGYWDRLDELGRHVTLSVVMPSSWQDGLHPMPSVPAKSSDAPWTQYRVDTRFQFRGNPFRYYFRPRQLAAVLDEVQPEIVHVEQEPESLCLLQMSLLKSRHRYRLIFVAWENVHPLRRGFLFRRLNFRRADGAILGNRAALERCLRFGFAKPVALIPHYGFRVTRTAPRPARQTSPFVVGYAGRLVPEKGLRILASATRGLAGVALHIAGGGPLAEELRAESHVRILGTLPRAEMGRFWDSIDVLVVPSLTTRIWAEQFGRVIAEAMAAGVPVVGSSSGAIPEVIGNAGIIVAEADAVALRRVIADLQRDPALRMALAEKGLERVRCVYGADVISRATALFYAQVLKDGNVLDVEMRRAWSGRRAE